MLHEDILPLMLKPERIVAPEKDSEKIEGIYSVNLIY
jgi:hypothetical protein